MGKKTLTEMIKNDFHYNALLGNQPKVVRNYMEKKFPEQIEVILDKDTIKQTKKHKNFIDYINKYQESPFIRTFWGYRDKPVYSFEGTLIHLFNEEKNVKEFSDNLEKNILYEEDSKTGTPFTIYKLSQKGDELVKKSFNEYLNSEDFEKVMFVTKLGDAIGYDNLMKISGIETFDIKGENVLTLLYNSLERSIISKLLNKNLEDIDKYYIENRIDSVFTPNGLTNFLEEWRESEYFENRDQTYKMKISKDWLWNSKETGSKFLKNIYKAIK